MYPNLMGQKAVHKLTDEQMADIISVSRITYIRKMANGDFTVPECKSFCRYFGKPFDYLFSTQEELPALVVRS